MGLGADLAAHIEFLQKLRCEIRQVKSALPAVSHGLAEIATGFESAGGVLDTALAATEADQEGLFAKAANALVDPGSEEYISSQERLHGILKTFFDEKAAKAAAEREAEAAALAALQSQKKSGKHKKGKDRGSRSVPPPRSGDASKDPESAEVGEDATDENLRVTPSKKGPKNTPIDMSMFVQARWEAERRRGLALGATGGGGVQIFRDFPPKPQMDMKVCVQVKGNHILTNTEEKILKIYQEIEKSSHPDRVGFLCGASLTLFQKLAQERSDCPSKAKGGDLGLFGKGDKERMLVDTAFQTPKGSVSPPFRTNLGFHVFYCQDRKI